MVGPRIFDVDEANALVPDLRRIFDRLDALRERMRATKLRLNALELIWGEKIREEDCPDHRELVHYLEEMKRLEEAVQGETDKVAELGGVVKGIEPGLVDFYGVRDGRLVYLCWQRGEGAIGHWHHIDAGFAGREPLGAAGGSESA
ncbi:MAG TPA: DUF2203 domain-containing protein [Planctomycetota bacterium]|jgi:hypothetical protein|nr:DUF2203 domain-containing protein [Planctomycetota bacterium]